MIAIEGTLVVQKPHAVAFVALPILVVGLGARFVTKVYLPARAKAREKRVTAEAVGLSKEEAVLAALGTPADELDMSRPHVMVATRGGQRLISFASTYTKQLNGILFVLFVRQINIQFGGDSDGPSLEEDFEARAVFSAAAKECKTVGVSMVPIYVVSRDVAYSIPRFCGDV